MFDRIYLQQEHTEINATIRRIFDDLLVHGYDLESATDYLAGMTDRFALAY
jgi:dGTP triphosphohydrolase